MSRRVLRRPSQPIRRTGTSCSGCSLRIWIPCGWPQPTPRAAVMGRSRESWPGLPLHLGSAGRRAAAHQGPRGGADGAWPRGFGDLPGGRRHTAAGLRGVSRPCRPGPLQRLGGPGRARLPVGHPGAAGGGAWHVRHVPAPAAPSLSLLACWVADGPIVATVHTATPRSRVMHASAPALRTALEKGNGWIAVSEAARTTLVEHTGGEAVLIPNGVTVRRYEKASPLPGWPGAGGALGFLGRMDEPRKGLDVLLRAFETLGTQRPGLRLLIAGPGDTDDALEKVSAPLRERVIMLGQVTEDDKARAYHSVDVFCAPNTGGESFGIVLAEAMASGAPIVASDLDAFRQVLRGGRAGELFETGDPGALARAAGRLLDDPQRRADLSAAAC